MASHNDKVPLFEVNLPYSQNERHRHCIAKNRYVVIEIANVCKIRYR